MCLTLHMMGPPEIRLDGQPVTNLNSDKVRALLFYLAVEGGRAHRRETLAGLLWPDYPERSARTNLSNALSNLRTALADREATIPFFHVSREAIQLNAQSDSWVDATAFDALVARGEWEEAITLYRGPFLEGFSLSDSPPFEQWALVVRERLQRQMMAALAGVTAECEESGDYAHAIETTRRQLELEPWHEGAHRSLMRALALSGERASALAQYEACARTLKQELDVAPGVQTTELYEDIRDGKVAPRKETPRRREAVPPPVSTGPTEAASVPLTPTTAARLVSPAGERRWVTALHAEVHQAAALLDEVGPEEWTKAISRALDTVEAQIQRYGGEVIQRREEGVVALFGVPSAHEDDAERAVLAALGMRESMRDAPELRIGVDTGEVLVTYTGDRRQVVGRALTLARRASVAASPGTVVVGENAYRLVGPLFEWEALEGQAAGEMYLPLARKGDVVKARGIPGLSSPLVGRDEELRALEEAIERLRSGIGGIVTLVGEAGLGKSRLVAECRGAVTAPRQWIEGRCLSFATNVAYHLWLDMLRALLGVTQDAPPDTVRDVLRDRVRALCPDRYDDVYPYLARLMSLPLEARYEMVRNLHGESLKAEVFYALETLLTCTAEQQPLIVVCEDLHWADPTSLALLERVLPLVDRVPLLLLCIFRPETERGCWRIKETAAREYRHRHIDLWLDSLTADESAALVGNLLRVEDLPGTLRVKILDHAQGNPFYVEEILRSLIDDGAIVYDVDKGHWQATRPVDDIAFPDTLHAMLTARIDRLPPDARRVLQLASVVGRIFSYPVVSEIASRFPLPEGGRTRGRGGTVSLDTHLLAHLVTLEREQLIRERARLPEREYVFQHVLTQEAAYDGLLKGERRTYHRQVAEALERLFAERIEEQLGLLAHHWERAEEQERAAEYLLRAGEQARLAYANEEAIDYYRRALALLDSSPLRESRRDWRMTALKGLGIVYYGTGQTTEAENPLREAIALGREIEVAPQELVRLYFWLGEVLFWLARYDELLETGKQGLRLLGDNTRTIGGALMMGHIAIAYEVKKNRAKYYELISQMERFIRRLSYVQELRPAHIHIAEAYDSTKNTQKAMQWVESLAARALQHHDLRGVGEADNLAGWFLSHSGDLENSILRLGQALDMYVKLGDRKLECRCLRDLARRRWMHGDLARAEDYAHRLLNTVEVMEVKGYAAGMYIVIGRIYLSLEAWEKAMDVFQSALEFCRHAQNTWKPMAFAQDHIGRIYLAQEDNGRAATQFREAIDLMSSQGKADSRQFVAAISGLEEAYQDVDAFRAYCCRFRRAHAKASGTPSTKWYLELVCGGVPQLGQEQDLPLGSPDWIWQDPFSDSVHVMAQNGLQVYAANGRNLWGPNLSAPRMLRAVSGDLVIQTMCLPVSDGKPAIGGLLLWADMESYLRLDRGVFGSKDVSFSGCVENQDVIVGRGLLGVDASGRVYLRLERVGDQVSAYCSTDGEQWYTVGQTTFPVEDPIQVGLHAIGDIDRTIYHGAYPDGTAIRFESFQMWQGGT